MTRSQMVLWSVLAGLLAFAPAGSAWAAGTSQVPDPSDLLTTHPDARGAKIHGQLSIFYTLSANVKPLCENQGSPTVNMHIALQGWQGNNSNVHTAGQLIRRQCYYDMVAQQKAVEDLIQSQLLPKFGYSTFLLKDADNLVQDEGNEGTDASPWFLMMDFLLAAK